jgi:hypothetical protein
MQPSFLWLRLFVLLLGIFLSGSVVTRLSAEVCIDPAIPSEQSMDFVLSHADRNFGIRSTGASWNDSLSYLNLTGVEASKAIDFPLARLAMPVAYVDTEFSSSGSHGSLVRGVGNQSRSHSASNQGQSVAWQDFVQNCGSSLGGQSIVNMSLHLGAGSEARNCLEKLQNAGSTLVISSGNYGDREMDFNNRLPGAIVVGSVDPKTGWVDAYSQGGAEVTVVAPVGYEMMLNGSSSTYYGTSYAAPQVSESMAEVEAVLGKLSSSQHKALLQNASLQLLGSDSGQHGAGMLNHLKMMKVAERIRSGAFSRADLENSDSQLFNFSEEADELKRRAASSSGDEKKSLLYQALLLDQNPERAKDLLTHIPTDDKNYLFFESLTQVGESRQTQIAFIRERLSRVESPQKESGERLIGILEGKFPQPTNFELASGDRLDSLSFEDAKESLTEAMNDSETRAEAAETAFEYARSGRWSVDQLKEWMKEVERTEQNRGTDSKTPSEILRDSTTTKDIQRELWARLLHNPRLRGTAMEALGISSDSEAYPLAYYQAPQRSPKGGTESTSDEAHRAEQELIGNYLSHYLFEWSDVLKEEITWEVILKSISSVTPEASLESELPTR